MNEVTRIMTVRITFIDKEESFRSKVEDADIVKDAIKDTFDADDVVIDNVQDFIMEKEESK